MSRSELSRLNRLRQLQYANAQTVANVIIKELYRDVLSPNDRPLAQPRGERSGVVSTFVVSSSADHKKLQFKGMLSIGTFTEPIRWSSRRLNTWPMRLSGRPTQPQQVQLKTLAGACVAVGLFVLPLAGGWFPTSRALADASHELILTPF